MMIRAVRVHRAVRAIRVVRAVRVFWVVRAIRQGCAVSRYRFGRTRFEAIFWICIGIGDTFVLYRAQPCASANRSCIGLGIIDPVSGSGSPNHFYCIEHNLVYRKAGPLRSVDSLNNACQFSI